MRILSARQVPFNTGVNANICIAKLEFQPGDYDGTKLVRQISSMVSSEQLTNRGSRRFKAQRLGAER